MKRRLGLLACDHVWEPLRTRHGDYPDMFAAWLRAADADFELVTYDAEAGELPRRIDTCDAWLISGSRAGVYETLHWIPPLTEFVRAAHAAARPILGICFGHQLVAHGLGGRTELAAGGWGIGNIALRLRATSRGAAPRPALALHMAHQDQVVALPPGAVWLAEAAHCPHAMFALGSHVLGCQAHPEFTPAFMREMTREESFHLPPDRRAAALDSYERPVDDALVGAWAAAFLGLGRLPGGDPWLHWQYEAGLV